jgi:hypothetical protein
MEVHAHTHTARKKWTHYFWEFLMLFLAVFCGFLAEYQLEHKIEKDRERVYMKAMVEDLKKDTANINAAVKGNRIFINSLDTLLDLLSNPQQDASYQRKIFINSLKNTYRFMTIQFSELTLSQLKYSGGFRLIKNREVANSIIQYDLGADACKLDYNFLIQYYHVNEVTHKELFNMRLARKTFKAFEMNPGTVFLPENGFEKLVDEGNYLDDKNPALLSRYHDDILYYQTTLSNVTNSIAGQKTAADSLIQLIRKKYRIKE